MTVQTIFARLCQSVSAALLASLMSLSAQAQTVAKAPPSAIAQPVMPLGKGICQFHANAAEQRYRLPSMLLASISVAETGRTLPGSTARTSWPWTINAEGNGKWFATKQEAINEVRKLQKAGVKSIDVGCMQVNLLHHSKAFGSLEQAFDPASNTDYAARFLLELKEETKTWNQAVAFYHSRNAEHHVPYRSRVLAIWSGQVRDDGESQRQAAITRQQSEWDKKHQEWKDRRDALLARQRQEIEIRQAAIAAARQRSLQLASIRMTGANATD
jgi:hypothetical protein